jgi:long-chain acyl-CoA synthetase
MVPVGNLLIEVSPAVPASENTLATGPVYRNVAAKDEYASLPGITTLYELFSASAAKYPDNKCLGKRATGVDGEAGPYEWDTYKQVADKVAACGSAFSAVGIEAKGRVGVFGANSPEWMIAMQVTSPFLAQQPLFHQSINSSWTTACSGVRGYWFAGNNRRG